LQEFCTRRTPAYKGYLAGGTLGMAGDHVEHAITYWVMWQLFDPRRGAVAGSHRIV